MQKTSARTLLPLLLLAALLHAGASLHDSSRPLAGAEVYRRTLPAVAWVHAPGSGKGTGWVLDRGRRLLVTCFHVVGDNDTVEVIFPVRVGGIVQAEPLFYHQQRSALEKSRHHVRGRVLRRDRGTDLALVELEALPPECVALPLAERGPAAGTVVHVVGNRYDLGLLWGYTGGVVRQVKVLREGYFSGGRQLAKGARVVVAEAPINEGDSGAPLLNERGEVVGVAAAVAWEAHGAGLFVSVEEVRALACIESPSVRTPPVLPSVYRRGLRALALVKGASPERSSLGFVLDRSRRLLVTTRDIVGKEEMVNVAFPVYQQGEVVADALFYRDQQALLVRKGRQVRGCVLAVDARRNLALLELQSLPDDVSEQPFATVPPAPGDSLHLFSNPPRLGILWAYAAGCVRQLGHANLGQTDEGPDPAVVIVQAPLVEGEGGAPVLNERGEMVALTSGKVGPQQQIVHALSLAEVQAFVSATRPHWQPGSAAELCSRAERFLKARLPDRAVLDLNAALRLDPRCARAYDDRARAHLLAGRDEAARADCDRALALEPKRATAYCRRAQVWCRRGDLAKALADCDAALRLDPRSALAFCTRAHVRLLQGDADRARADCDEALWLDRRLARAYLYRGQALALKDDNEAAVKDYTMAVQLNPRLAEAYRCRGDAHWGRSDVAAARTDYEQALSLNPKDARAYRGRGRARAARADFDRALADYDQALRLDPGLSTAYLDRGSERVRRGRIDAAVADYAVALRNPSLRANVLAVVERRAAELGQGDNEDLPACCRLCQGVLGALLPLVEGKVEARKALTTGLRAAREEKDMRRRANGLRRTLAVVRDRL